MLRRLALVIPILLGISIVVFVMLRTAGGDPAELRLGMRADPESIAKMQHDMGLDRPLYIQYSDYIGKAMTGDLGRSFVSNARVTDEIFARFPATIELATTAMVIAILVGFTTGVIAATRQHSLFDYSSTFVALLGVSIPTFWLGLILIIVFGLSLEWLPLSGRINPRLGADPSGFLLARSLLDGQWTIFVDALKHLILPALTLAGWPAAIIARMTRAALIESMGEDYIRTARAKGLRDRFIVRHHALRNALIPVLTIVGLEFGTLLGGAVVTETVFAWPGVGQLTINAILSRDYQVAQGVVLLLGAIFVILNLVVDLVYAMLDPRIRYT